MLSKYINSNEETNMYVYYMSVTALDKQEIGRCKDADTSFEEFVIKETTTLQALSTELHLCDLSD